MILGVYPRLPAIAVKLKGEMEATNPSNDLIIGEPKLRQHCNEL